MESSGHCLKFFDLVLKVATHVSLAQGNFDLNFGYIFYFLHFGHVPLSLNLYATSLNECLDLQFLHKYSVDFFVGGFKVGDSFRFKSFFAGFGDSLFDPISIFVSTGNLLSK